MLRAAVLAQVVLVFLVVGCAPPPTTLGGKPRPSAAVTATPSASAPGTGSPSIDGGVIAPVGLPEWLEPMPSAATLAGRLASACALPSGRAADVDGSNACPPLQVSVEASCRRALGEPGAADVLELAARFIAGVGPVGEYRGPGPTRCPIRQEPFTPRDPDGTGCSDLAWTRTALLVALGDERAALRATAARLASYVPLCPPQGVAALQALLRRTVPETGAPGEDERRTAHRALAALTAYGFGATPALPELERIALHGSPAGLRAEAMVALAAIHRGRDVEDRSLPRERLPQPVPRPVLGKTLAALVAGLADSDASVRRGAALGLQTLAHFDYEIARAHQALRRTMKDPDHSTRRAAWYAVGTDAQEPECCKLRGTIGVRGSGFVELLADEQHPGALQASATGLWGEVPEAGQPVRLFAPGLPSLVAPAAATNGYLIALGRLAAPPYVAAFQAREARPKTWWTSIATLGTLFVFPAHAAAAAVDPWTLSAEGLPVGLSPTSVRTAVDLGEDETTDILETWTCWGHPWRRGDDELDQPCGPHAVREIYLRTSIGWELASTTYPD